MSALQDHPHRRFNPLTGDCVLVSPNRNNRPWQGQAEGEMPKDRLPHDPQCPLCAGTMRANGLHDPACPGPHVFANGCPALLTDADRDVLSDILKTEFPCAMGWHGAPAMAGKTDHWQVHAHFDPPSQRSAHVRKVVAGYEILAAARRDLTAETAAAILPDQSADHYPLASA